MGITTLLSGLLWPAALLGEEVAAEEGLQLLKEGLLAHRSAGAFVAGDRVGEGGFRVFPQVVGPTDIPTGRQVRRQRQVNAIVLSAKESQPPPVAALRDVTWAAWSDHSGQSPHARSIPDRPAAPREYGSSPNQDRLGAVWQ